MSLLRLLKDIPRLQKIDGMLDKLQQVPGPNRESSRRQNLSHQALNFS